MGGTTRISANFENTFSTDIVQASNQKCSIACTSSFNNNTVIIIGGTGDITISSACAIIDSSCQLKAAFDTDIENTIKVLAEQSSSAMSGFDLTWHDVKLSLDVTNVIQNSISQLMNSSCALTATSNMDNNFFYIQDRVGDITLSSSAAITAGTCSMDNYAKASAFNSATTEAKQSSSVINIFGIMALGFIVMIVVIGGAILAFVLTGGANKLIKAQSETAQSAIKVVGENPQLLAAL